MNTHQNHILSIFENAQTSIQVAVSWFTDETLINKLIRKASSIKVEVLLSSDELNLLRHNSFSQLQKAGGKVRKIGSNDALMGNFMHSKFVIIDDKMAYGGSYNFTDNARTNFENFKRYDYSELSGLRADFNNWLQQSYDFLYGVTNPEEVVIRLKQKFIENERQKNSFSEKYFSTVDFSEAKYIEQKENEIKQIVEQRAVKQTFETQATKETLHRETYQNMVSGTTKATSSGSTSTQVSGVTVPKHRNFGGISYSQYSGNKMPNSYALARYQKRFIEQNYNFLKCRIENDTLICIGEAQPENCEKYKIRIEFRAGHHPRVFILNPHIEIRPEIHIYREGHLCLFYPPDMKWRDTTQMALYTIPWTIEWIVLYELWKLSGKWEGAEVSHIKSNCENGG
jgi:hypothetical protein